MDESVSKAISEQLTVSVEIAARALGLSRNSGYLAVAAGQLPSIRIGGRILVPTAPLRKMLGLGAEAA